MSSTNDTYQHLLVQVQPKSILKKSTSPRLFETSIDMNSIEKNSLVSPEIFVEKDIILNHSRIDSSSTSDDEILSRLKIKSKKTYSRPLLVHDTLLSSSSSSSSDNEERKNKRSLQESKTTCGYLSKYQQKDMQLDEFMRTYQQQGGIPFPLKENHLQAQKTTNKFPHNSNPSSLIKQDNQEIVNNDKMNLIESIDTLTLSTESISPIQILFDIARSKQIDRRTKIDQIRQYVEEQIGISAFLTIYKLIKSSQIPIDFKQKPFCFYENFIPHLCCLIILESEQQQQQNIKAVK